MNFQKFFIGFYGLIARLLNLAGEPTTLKVRVGLVDGPVRGVGNYVIARDVVSNKVVELSVHFDNSFDQIDFATDHMLQAVLNSLMKLGYRTTHLYWGDEVINFRHYPELVSYDRLRIIRNRIPAMIETVRGGPGSRRKINGVIPVEGQKVLLKNLGRAELDNKTFVFKEVVLAKGTNNSQYETTLTPIGEVTAPDADLNRPN